MGAIVNRVYDDMRNRILHGEFHANSLFVEQSIATEYDVSRGAAREALQLLCNAKFLIKHPRKGYFIYNFSDDELREILQARYFLELGAMGIVVEKCTDGQIEALYDTLSGPELQTLPDNTVNSSFHLAMASLSGNQTICELLRGLLDITARKSLNISCAENRQSHIAIIQALLARDMDLCSAALKADLGIQ